MKVVNLFGEIVESEQNKKRGSMSPYQRFKAVNKYRKSDGPQCKTCEYHVIFRHHDKRYHKCELIGISNSEATDIRVSYVCNKFKSMY